MSRERVMLVHYNPRQVDALSRALEGAGLNVDVCSDGMTALSSFSSVHPDLIILEAMIPKKNGFEVCREIKASPDGKHIPVVITSDIHRGRRYRTDAMSVYGCQEFLERGFTPEQLVSTVRRLLPGAFIDAPEQRGAGDAAKSGDGLSASADGGAESDVTTAFDEGEINTLLDTIFPSDDASDLAARLRSRRVALSTEATPIEAAPVEATSLETAPSAPALPAVPSDESWSFSEIDTSSMQGEFDLPSLLPPAEPDHHDTRLIEALESLDAPAVATIDGPSAEEPFPEHPIGAAAAEARIEDMVDSMRRERGGHFAPDVPQKSAEAGANRPRAGAPRMIPLLAAAVVGCSAIAATTWWMLRPSAPVNVAAAASDPLPVEFTSPPSSAAGPVSQTVSSKAGAPARAASTAVASPPKAAPSAKASAPAARVAPAAESSPAASPDAASTAPAIQAEPGVTSPDLASGGDIASDPGPTGASSGLDSEVSSDGGPVSVAGLDAIATTGDGLQMPIRTLATEPGALIDIGQADVRPSHISTPPPAYPASARSLRIYGDVTLQALVQENGEVGEVRVLSSPSKSLADAAAKAVRAWRYTPAQKDGVRVRTWMNEKISFRLK